jgi:CheY-like chemotaxis protein/two-component sensor histidine kinase
LSEDTQTIRLHDVISRQFVHLTRLVDDLLDVSRVTRGKIELRLATVDFREAVRHGVETTRPGIEAKRHHLVLSLPETPLWVSGDSTRLAQIVANLLNNAAKYTPGEGRIEVVAHERDEIVCLSVRDNGIGIPADLLTRVFEPFAQAPDRGDAAHGGLGIGLTLVERLVTLHGGSVEARSGGRGLGSEFVLMLPASAAAPMDALETHADDDSPHAPKARILVVDDNVDAANSLADLLGGWGHATRTAYDGVAALEAALDFAPEIVLLDLDLPKVDGIEVARRMRATTPRSRLLLVAVTGFGQKGDVERTQAAGFDGHLVKPIDTGSLRGLLLRRSDTSEISSSDHQGVA